MTGRSTRIILVLALSVLLLNWGLACGDEEEATTDSKLDEPVTTETAGDDGAGSEDPFAAVEDIEATVEVTVNGETTVVWSQKDGSWRWQDPQDPESYVIYNADEGKMWVVNDKVALESEEAGDDTMYWGMSPAGMLGMYTMLPGGTMTDDTFEINVPGAGRVVVEFKGPQGLPSKFVTYDASGAEEESIEFEYTDVGNVSDDLFVLPPDVVVQAAPDMPDMPDIPDMPTDGSMPMMPAQ